MTELFTLLSSLDPKGSLPQRHVWLIHFFDWLRGDASSPQVSEQRMRGFLDALDAQPELAERFGHWWRVLDEQVDASTLLADFGFAERSAFFSELGDRLRQNFLSFLVPQSERSSSS